MAPCQEALSILEQVAVAKYWTEEPPEAPDVAPSDWYWFWWDGESEPLVMEVWPKRNHWPPGLWGERISPPTEKPRRENEPKKDKKSAKKTKKA